jgi:predicted ABC-type transport system involved in lysophospholipase L1 biosynthesis ATPase subunit
VIGLVLDGVPVPGVPAEVRVQVGEQRFVEVPDPNQGRRLADLATGLAAPPAGARVRAAGPVRLVPAEGGLLPYLTVLGNLVHGCATSRMPRREAGERAAATARWFGLEDVTDRYPHEITAGRRRLAGVARALGAQPVAVVLEDAPGLPTWGTLLDLTGNPQLLSAALLLLTPDRARAAGFAAAGPDGGSAVG